MRFGSRWSGDGEIRASLDNKVQKSQSYPSINVSYPMGGRTFLERQKVFPNKGSWFGFNSKQCCESRPCALWVDKRFGVFEWMPLGDSWCRENILIQFFGVNHNMWKQSENKVDWIYPKRYKMRMHSDLLICIHVVSMWVRFRVVIFCQGLSKPKRRRITITVLRKGRCSTRSSAPQFFFGTLNLFSSEACVGYGPLPVTVESEG